jgi:hypothetical protein
LASFTVIIVVIPALAPFAVVLAWLYIRIAPRFVQAQRDLRRLESVSLSPAFAGFDELLRGLSHVRAFAMESRYQDRFYEKVDKFQSYDHVYVRRWTPHPAIFLTKPFASGLLTAGSAGDMTVCGLSLFYHV